MKLTKPKVIDDGKTPMTTEQKVKYTFGSIVSAMVAGFLYMVIAGLLFFAVGFAICFGIMGLS